MLQIPPLGRRPDKNSSRSAGLRQCMAFGSTITRASSTRPMGPSVKGASGMSGETTPLIEQHWFDDDGVVPNNPRLPLVVYREVLESGPSAAAACERRFAGN